MNSTFCKTPPSQGLLSAELRSLINERNILTTKTRIKGTVLDDAVACLVYLLLVCEKVQINDCCLNLPTVLNALDDVSRDAHKLKQEEKERNLRTNAIQEILTSEASYLQQLETIMKVRFMFKF